MTIAGHPLTGLGYVRAAAKHDFVRLADEGVSDASAMVAEEVPIALVYNGQSHVVVMGTPLDLEDLAVGFSLTEGIVDDARDVEHVEPVRASHGIEVQIEIPVDAAARLRERSRGLVSRTGCGLCGVESIGDAMRVPESVGRTLAIDADALWRATDELSRRQRINSETNTVHAAGWADSTGEVRVVREDVGRHNALDKVLGALARSERAPRDGFIVVTSRASYEMVQKAATCGVELLAAISRPTGLAVRFARASGLTLVGLVRGRTANVYCGAERIAGVGTHS